MLKPKTSPALALHTPGPWGIGMAGSTPDWHYMVLRPHAYTIDTENRIASISGGSDNPKADAELIARAPEMAAKIEADRATIAKQVEEIERLRKALGGLVNVNEEWNAAVEETIGRPPHWTDAYLDAARAALKPEPESR